MKGSGYFQKQFFITDQDTGNGAIDYDIYIMQRREKILYILAAAGFLSVLAFIFYHNIVVSLFITPLALFYPKMRTKEIVKKRKDDLNLQFKEMLYSLSASLSSGKSLETSFRGVLKDLCIIYPDEETPIIKEIQLIIRRLDMNEQIEGILSDFAERSHLEDVRSFAGVLGICNKRGGNVVEIIRNTSNVINDKIEIKQEIATVLAQKKFEQKILGFMPVGLIIFLSLTQRDYMEPVFNTAAGRAVMTAAAAFITAGYLITKKIMDIKI